MHDGVRCTEMATVEPLSTEDDRSPKVLPATGLMVVPVTSTIRIQCPSVVAGSESFITLSQPTVTNQDHLLSMPQHRRSTYPDTPFGFYYPLDLNASDCDNSIGEADRTTSSHQLSADGSAPGLFQVDIETDKVSQPGNQSRSRTGQEDDSVGTNRDLRIPFALSKQTPTDKPKVRGQEVNSTTALVTDNKRSAVAAAAGGGSGDDDASGYMNLRKKSRRKVLEDRPRPKRQTARDMCRPLKQWLYCHRDTPYPTKSEKQELALLSHMTLTQVSNWFANARRRLKNTVSGGPEVTWARRMKLYNRFVVGNQELLSVSSDDTMWDEEEEKEEEEEEEFEEDKGVMQRRDVGPDDLIGNQLGSLGSSSASGDGSSIHRAFEMDADGEFAIPAVSSPSVSTPGKFKQGILQRYLSDAYDIAGHVKEEGEEEEESGKDERETTRGKERHRHVCRHRNASGSLSSHDYEEVLLSARSTPNREPKTLLDETEEEEEEEEAEDGEENVRNVERKISSSRDLDDLYWKEISAALALTDLAMRSRMNSVSSRNSSRM